MVLEVDPRLQEDPSLLSHIYVNGTGDAQVPLAAVAHFERGFAPLAVRHQGQFPAATLSFNLLPGEALGSAADIVDSTARALRDAGERALRIRRQRRATSPSPSRASRC